MKLENVTITYPVILYALTGVGLTLQHPLAEALVDVPTLSPLIARATREYIQGMTARNRDDETGARVHFENALALLNEIVYTFEASK